jgi:hypothetical protein
MNKEEFDKIISGAMPPVAITDERLDHFIDTVLDRAAMEPQKGAAKPGRTWKIWTQAHWPTLVPALRFALPLVVAVVLGITVGGQYEEDWPVAQFSTLYLSTTLVPVGS